MADFRVPCRNRVGSHSTQGLHKYTWSVEPSVLLALQVDATRTGMLALRHRSSGRSTKPSGDDDEVVQFQPMTTGTRRRDMAGFIQLIEFEATDINAVVAKLEQFRDENPGVLTVSTSTTAEDRDRPGTYISIVEFPSYEKAMDQQSNPATSAFTASLAELMSGEPRFRNLDVRSVLTNP